MTAIGVLFFPCRPSTIVRRILTIIFDTVEAHPRRSIAHIHVEVFERHPSFAYCDTAPAIVFVSEGAGIEAAGLHRTPDAVNPGSSLTVRKPRLSLLLQTTTRLRVTCGQIGSLNKNYSPTFAATSPIHWLSSFKIDNSKSAKFKTTQVALWRSVADFCHDHYYNTSYALVNAVTELTARVAELEKKKA